MDKINNINIKNNQFVKIKRIRKKSYFLLYYVLKYLKYSSCNLTYLSKQLGISKQNCLFYLRKLEKLRLIKQNPITKFWYLINNKTISETAIRLFKSLTDSTSKPNRTILRNYLSRYHNPRGIIKLKKKTRYKKLTTISDHVQVNRDTIIVSMNATSVIDYNIPNSFINFIDEKISALPYSVESVKYLVDVATVQDPKVVIEDFLNDPSKYSTFWFDSSLGYLEREYTQEVNYG